MPESSKSRRNGSASRANGNGSVEAGPSTSTPPSQHQLNSVRAHSRLPVSLQQSAPLKGARPPKSLSKIPDKKLRANLSREVLSQRRAREHASEVDRLLHQGPVNEDAGLIETEGPMERTAKLTQKEIKDSIGLEAARKAFSLDLSGGRGGVSLGPYRSAYTPNGRQLVLAGRAGRLAAFDWQSGKLSCEIQVKETVRDVTWLHNNSFFAVAQKKNVYIYDNSGAEVHRLRDHMDVNRLEFLRYHFLLATVGSAGWLKYQDVSTGVMVTQHRTKLGGCSTMAQNPHTAVINLGHNNGTVTMWTPNLSTPALTLLAHQGPVSGISVSPRDGGREMATAGLEGAVKVWDCRMLGKGPVREWASRRPANEVKYSQRGLLATTWGSHVSIYDTKTPMSTSSRAPPGPYLTNNFPKGQPLSIQFCPFEDVLGVGHNGGFTSLVVPGAGEPRFDSSELDPYEGKTARREREVRNLLDKIQPDMISLDPSFLGGVETRDTRKGLMVNAVLDPHGGIARAPDGTPFARLSRLERLRLEGKADEGDSAAFKGIPVSTTPHDGASSDDDDDEGGNTVGQSHNISAIHATSGPETKEKKKSRGRNTSLKRYLRKKKLSNVVDANSVQARDKLERVREENASRAREAADGGVDGEGKGALGVFDTTSRKRRR